MTIGVGILRCGLAGNILSIRNAVEKAGGNSIIIEKAEQFKNVDKFILPGVGSFRTAMTQLNEGELIDALKENLHNKPMLGICLGMQILATIGFEYGNTKGLNIIDGEVRPILADAKIPHMGFNSIQVINSNKLLTGLDKQEFYFMHSFEFVNYTNIGSLTEYGGHKFISSVYKDNIYGVQFHPEKSRDQGIRLLRNFIEI